MRKLFAASAMVCLALSGLLAHGDNSHFPMQQDASVKTAKVSGNVYMLQGPGGNVGAINGPDGILMIDEASRKMATKFVTRGMRAGLRPTT